MEHIEISDMIAEYCITKVSVSDNEYTLDQLENLEALTDQNRVADLAGTISGKMNLNLTISKAGYNSVGITGGGGFGGGGTSNYNLLTNKPSINSVMLQRNLTAEQLGLNGGSGGEDIVQMTYEETLAELNTEEVTARTYRI